MRKGSKASSELRAKLRLAQLGNKASEETKAKMRESHKGYAPSLECHQKAYLANKGCERSEEFRNRLRDLTNEQMASPAMRQRLSEASTKWFADTEHRQAHKATMKARMSDPQTRRKLSVSLRQRPPVTPETRVKLAEASAKQRMRWPHPKTSLEYALADYLQLRQVQFQEQARIGRYVVDAYDEQNNVVYEADGSFWHRDKDREARRDSYLLERGIARVVHLNEKQLEGFLPKRR